MIFLFISSVACLIGPAPAGVPKSAQMSSGISCRVFRMTSESKILKYVEPEYPGNTRTIQGNTTVYLKADVDQQGRVKDVRFFWSDRSFGEAAASAVKQWLFEPIVVDGKPVESTHALEIIFQGRRNKVVATAWRYPDEFRVYETPFQNAMADRSSKVLRKVDPIYPESARWQNIEGTVAMEALFSEAGRVEALLFWKSIPELDAAAIEAFSQWVYEPLIVNNTPSKFIAKFYIRFHKGR